MEVLVKCTGRCGEDFPYADPGATPFVCFQCRQWAAATAPEPVKSIREMAEGFITKTYPRTATPMWSAKFPNEPPPEGYVEDGNGNDWYILDAPKRRAGLPSKGEVKRRFEAESIHVRAIYFDSRQFVVTVHVSPYVEPEQLQRAIHDVELIMPAHVRLKVVS